MSLSDLIAVHDEAALAALASLGIVRRAKRDFEAGKAAVVSRDEAAATVIADGKTVTIPASGLTAATCGCPATGVCRHILLAVFALREDAPDNAASVRSAPDELHALNEAEVHKFAGADWDKAINLARISGQATLTEDGANLSVQLPDAEFPVVFLAGQGLTGAIFKGPKTAKRRTIAAAALIVRQHTGAQRLDQIAQDDAKVEQMSPLFLRSVQDAIVALVAGVFRGGAVVAEDQVFDLSISARAQSAPRLTALLRGLVQQSRQGRAHHIDFREDRFLADASHAYALTKALERHPENTQLTGTLRRNYRDRDALDLIVLGAAQWKAASGARGLRIYGCAPGENAWYTTGQARAAGMDPSFSPRNAYDAPLWNGNISRELIGTMVHLRHTRISEDNQIAWDHGSHDRGPMPDLMDAGAGFRSWAEARADIARRSPVGLQKTAAPIPILLTPLHVGDARFHEIDQCYEVTIADKDHATMTITLPSDQHGTIALLQSHRTAIHAMLCEATVTDLRRRLNLISVLFKVGGNSLEVVNITLDQPQLKKSAFGSRALSFLKNTVKIGAVRPSTQPAGQIEALCHSVLDATAETLRFGQSEDLAELSQRSDGLQLALLAKGLRHLTQDPTADQALRVVYLATQIALATQMR